jgi:hypothetical protein
MKTATLTVLFLLGLVASIWLGLYFLGMVFYVFESDAYMPSTAYTPKWVFSLSILALLGGRKDVQRGVGKIYHLFGL